MYTNKNVNDSFYLGIKISIITVVRNGEAHIEETIKSVLTQTYKNIEYIIIDGNSTDKTTSIIKKYEKDIAYWISEEDNGIYDAMNKGIISSTGDWIIFINSDDFLVNNKIITQAVNFLSTSNSLIAYGNVLFINEESNEILLGKDWKEIKNLFRKVGMVIPHQGVFHAKHLFSHRKFNTIYKIAGDYELLLGYLKDHDADYIPLIISKMRYGGVSYQINVFFLLKEIIHAQRANGIKYNFLSSIWLYHTFISISAHYLKHIFGAKLQSRVRNIFRINILTGNRK